MNKKRTVLFIVLVVLALILVLFLTGVIPKIIGKQTAIKYVQEHYQNMNLRYNDIEFSTAYGDYIVSFVDKQNSIYNFRLNSKYFPTVVEYDSIGQGHPIEIENNEKSEKLVLMYKTIIDSIMEKDTALNAGECLYLDINGFVAPIERGERYYSREISRIT